MKKSVVNMYSFLVIVALILLAGWLGYTYYTDSTGSLSQFQEQTPDLNKKISGLLQEAGDPSSSRFQQSMEEYLATQPGIKGLLIYSGDNKLYYSRLESRNGRLMENLAKNEQFLLEKIGDGSYRAPFGIAHEESPLVSIQGIPLNISYLYETLSPVKVYRMLLYVLYIVSGLFVLTLLFLLILSVKEKNQRVERNDDFFEPPVPEPSQVSGAGDDFGTDDDLDMSGDFPSDDFSTEGEDDFGLPDDLGDLGDLSVLDDVDLSEDDEVPSPGEGDDLMGFSDESFDMGLDLSDEPDTGEGLDEPDDMGLSLDDEAESLEEMDLDLSDDSEDLGDLDLSGESDDLDDLGDFDLPGESDDLDDLGDFDLPGESDDLEDLGDLDLPGESDDLDDLDDMDLDLNLSDEEDGGDDPLGEDRDLSGELGEGDEVESLDFSEEMEADSLDEGGDLFGDELPDLPDEEEDLLGDLTDEEILSDNFMEIEEADDIEDLPDLEDFMADEDLADELSAEPFLGEEEVDPKLYSPRTDVCWESFLDDRLPQELDRASSENEDLSFVYLRDQSVQNDGDFKEFSQALTRDFPYRDMIFEWGDQGFAMILPNSDLVETLEKLDLFINDQPERDIRIGATSRNGRLLDKDQLIGEAAAAIRRTSHDNKIVGFRADPERYREAVSRS